MGDWWLSCPGWKILGLLLNPMSFWLENFNEKESDGGFAEEDATDKEDFLVDALGRTRRIPTRSFALDWL